MPNSSDVLGLVPLLFLLIPACSVTGQTARDNTGTSFQNVTTTDGYTGTPNVTQNVTAQTQAVRSGAAAGFELPEAVGAVVLLLILFGASIGISRLVNYCYHRDVNRLDFESKHPPSAQQTQKQKNDQNKPTVSSQTTKRSATPFGDQDDYQEATVSCGNTTTASKVRQEASISGNIHSAEERATRKTLDNANLPVKVDIWTVFNKIAPLDLAARPNVLPQTSVESLPPLVQRHSVPITKQQPVSVHNYQPITDGLPVDQLHGGKNSRTPKRDQPFAKKTDCTGDETVDVLYHQPILDASASSTKEQYEGNADTRTSQMDEQMSMYMCVPAGENPDKMLSSMSKEQLADVTHSSVLQPKEQSPVPIDDRRGIDLAQHKETDINAVPEDVNNYEFDKLKENSTTVNIGKQKKNKRKKKTKKRSQKDNSTQTQDDYEISIPSRDRVLVPEVESERATKNTEDAPPNVTRTALISQAPKSRKEQRKASKTSTSVVDPNTTAQEDKESRHTIETTPGDILPDVGQVNTRKRKLLDLLTAERGAMSPTRRHTFTQPSPNPFHASYHVVDVHREKDGTILRLQETMMGSQNIVRFKTSAQDIERGCHKNNGFEGHDDVFMGDRHSQSGRSDNERRVTRSSVAAAVSHSRLRALSMTSSMCGKVKMNQDQDLPDTEPHQTCWGSESNNSQTGIHDPQEYIRRLEQLRKHRRLSSTRAVSCADE
ncbi:uncharacterized protein LOC118417665 [Branchiostoma floridae]|uniref:Uncharacterized protein LOC118417665 n=1 Tax=Branchiostoma floridae TaxID=7739 RepID=A0A9J7LAF6_BRAFL|nr:uncharacterized protein LOC118417665 [Branchiostoma floridae]